MNRILSTHSRLFQRLFAVLALAGLLTWVGCSDDDESNNGGGTPTTSMSGAFVGAGDGGKLTVTIASTTLAPGLRAAKAQWGAGGAKILGAGSVASHGIGASGSADLDGGSVVTLSGTYSDETDTLNLTGGGYTFVGEYDDTGPAIFGAYAGPNGVGLFGVVQGGGVQVFCGSFVNTGATVNGRLNLIIRGDEVGGAGVPEGSSEGAGFEGTVTGTGNPRTVTLGGETGGGESFTATGDWDTTANTITGTWEQSDGVNVLDSGTWEASLCD